MFSILKNGDAYITVKKVGDMYLVITRDKCVRVKLMTADELYETI